MLRLPDRIDAPASMMENFQVLASGDLVFRPVTAAASTYEGDIGTIWNIASDGALVRQQDPFGGLDALSDAIDEHLETGGEIAQDLMEQAQEVADMQDSLDCALAVKTADMGEQLLPDSVKGGPRPALQPGQLGHGYLAQQFEQRNEPYFLLTTQEGKTWQVYRPTAGNSVVRPLETKTTAGEPQTVNLDDWENGLGHFQIKKSSIARRIIAEVDALKKGDKVRLTGDHMSWNYRDDDVDNYGFDAGEEGVVYQDAEPGDTFVYVEFPNVGARSVPTDLLEKVSFWKTAPPKNVANPEIWRKAEEAAKKSYGNIEDHYGAVNEIYQNMGGKFAAKGKDSESMSAGVDVVNSIIGDHPDWTADKVSREAQGIIPDMGGDTDMIWEGARNHIRDLVGSGKLQPARPKGASPFKSGDKVYLTQAYEAPSTIGKFSLDAGTELTFDRNSYTGNTAKVMWDYVPLTIPLNMLSKHKTATIPNVREIKPNVSRGKQAVDNFIEAAPHATMEQIVNGVQAAPGFADLKQWEREAAYDYLKELASSGKFATKEVVHKIAG